MKALPLVLFALTAATGAHAQTAPSQPVPAAEKPFWDENAIVMDKMMSGMAVPSTGDIDRDFTAMMIPHHQGAIDMAILELKYGHNEQLRRIAQEIIVDQQQEIAAMDLAIGASLPPSQPAPTQPMPAQPVKPDMSNMDMSHMNMN